MEEKEERRLAQRTYILLTILIISTLLAYWQVLGHDFVNYDDNVYVTSNEEIHNGLTANSLIWALTSSRQHNWHPLTWISHIIDCQLYGLNPKGHHLTSLLFHVANTLLLFIILTRMTGALWRSVFVAALFALHPLHVESVAWVAERKDVLSTFFMMLTIWAYVLYVEKINPRRYLLVVLLLALGLMSKPMLVTLPFVLLLLDFWPLGRLDSEEIRENSPSRQKAITHLILEKLPLLLLAVASSIVTLFVQQAGGAVKSFELYSLKVRIANALVSYTGYIGKMLWPDMLTVLYLHPGDALPLWKGAASALILALITVLVIRNVRKFPYVAVGWFWYLITLLPVIGVVQVGSQSMADRYTYIPLTGLFIIIAWGTPDILPMWRYRKKVLSMLAGAVITALMVVTWLQVKHWQNSITLFEHALSVNENNYIAHNNMGAALQEKGETEKAVEHYREAVRLYPEYSNAHNTLGNILLDKGLPDEAIKHYRAAVRANPVYTKAHYNLGNALLIKGRVDDAINQYRTTLAIDPEHASSYNNLGYALNMTGNYNEAITYLRAALKINPEHADAHYNLGNVLLEQDKAKEAITHYQMAISIYPAYINAHNGLGKVLLITGRAKEAIPHLKVVIKHKPNHATAHFNLGNAHLITGNLQKATSHYRTAIKLKPDHLKALNNIGVALIKTKRFNEAVIYLSEALRIKPGYKDARNNLAIVNQLLKKANE